MSTTTNQKKTQKPQPQNETNPVEQVVEEQQTQTSQTSNKETGKSRKKEIPAEVIQELSFIKKLQELQQEFHEKMKPLRELEGKLKSIQKQYNQDMMTVYKSKNKRNGERKKTGFVLKVLLPDGMAKLVGVKVGTYMSLPEYTKLFYKVLETRNLRYEQNKKVFRADDEMMKVFNLPASVNQSTDPNDKNGFNFVTLQRIFSQACKNAPRMKDETTATTATTATAATTTTATTATAATPTVENAKAEKQTSKKQTDDKQQKSKTVVTVTKKKQQQVTESVSSV